MVASLERDIQSAQIALLSTGCESSGAEIWHMGKRGVGDAYKLAVFLGGRRVMKCARHIFIKCPYLVLYVYAC